MGYDIKGLTQLKAKIRKLQIDSKVAVNRGIAKTAKLILADALSRVPVDKGMLRDSLGIELVPDQLTAYIYANALYAMYQEFGTGKFTEVPAGYEAYAMEFFVSGEGHTKPQPYMFPAFFANRDKLVPLIEAELEKLLKYDQSK